MAKRLCVLVALTVVGFACGGGRAVTEKRMLEWGPILNMYMATNFEGGNSDDIVLENGALYDAMNIYAESPLE